MKAPRPGRPAARPAPGSPGWSRRREALLNDGARRCAVAPATGRSAAGEGRSMSPTESAIGRLGSRAGGFATAGGAGAAAGGGAGRAGGGGAGPSIVLATRGAGGAACGLAAGAAAAAAPGLFTTNECPHLGHRILRPEGGTRRSSIW